MAESSIVFPEFTGTPWSDDIPEAWNFADVLDLECYLHEVRKVLNWTLERYHYNSVTSFVAFYKKYRESTITTLKDFYNRYVQVDFSTEFLSCVGLSYVFKLALTDALSEGRFSVTSKHLYFASCCLFPNDNVPTGLEKGEPLWPGELSEHVTVVLKFSISSRKGHIIMDFGYGLDIPVVVMEDGLSPQTEEFQKISRAGIRTHAFRHINSDYVLWTVKEVYQNLHRVFYLKKEFQRLDLPEKRHKVNPLQARVIYKGDIPASGYFTIVGKAFGHISAFTYMNGRFNTANILYEEVFLDGEIQNPILKSCVDALEGNAKAELQEMVFLCLIDQDFTSQVLSMDNEFRNVVNKRWNRTEEEDDSNSD